MALINLWCFSHKSPLNTSLESMKKGVSDSVNPTECTTTPIEPEA